MLDRRKRAPFTTDDLYAMDDKGNLVELLLNIDGSGIIALWTREADAGAEMERAFGDGASTLRYRELRKAGVGDNARGLVTAFVLEALHQNFVRNP